MTLSARPYAGPADLAAMGAVLSASWRMARPFVNATPGDLEWWQAGAHPFEAWSERIRVWEWRGEVVAYAWITPPGELDSHQRADLPSSLRATIVDASVAFAATSAVAWVESGGIDPGTISTQVLDADADLGRLLTGHGFTRAEAPSYSHWYRRLDRGPGIEAPHPPPGYRLRHVWLPDDLEARVEAHRSAFAPSRITQDKYRLLSTMPHYAPERDLVAEAPDGSLAAFTMVWWDPVGRIGSFEPVGTHADHRRTGLAKALNLAGLALLRDLGAVDALVLSACSNAASEALYAAAGFEAVTRHRAWTRPLPRAAPRG